MTLKQWYEFNKNVIELPTDVCVLDVVLYLGSVHLQRFELEEPISFALENMSDAIILSITPWETENEIRTLKFGVLLRL